MVLCHPRWLSTAGLTEFAMCWEELDSNPGLLICSQVRYHFRTEKCSDCAEILTIASSHFFKNLLLVAILSYLALLKSYHIEWKFFFDCVIV
jgi:hypothetical protein